MKLNFFVFVVSLILVSCKEQKKNGIREKERYGVVKADHPLKIDGNWDKPEWQVVEPLSINNFKGNKPDFLPDAQAKIMYDDNYLYLIFKVEDRYVRTITTEYNGPVWEDACVEFFFSPRKAQARDYFNLEINSGGTPLMHYNDSSKKSYPLSTGILKNIEIAHSLPEIIDPEIKEHTTWTLEYKLPLEILKKYSAVDPPKKGTVWQGNFYKIAENNSNPHYITWAPIGGEVPNFHQPEFFGILEFK
ncbi:carbohydrate-binding family 9-like protein [Arenibacter sp. F26102]|uniref:carbohydrate-binding family 9-like protein n=1 Tax=Arenibacter sp. F26102 TaxID=2926416 RepID=UPI001FF6AD74|nr:carbohydrate-binding family 9-like protein [Arenibacter sp. F26102]MCK0148025.1 carbohydrate-binding family 9-like protein [Arenibacter sp. F26102]